MGTVLKELQQSLKDRPAGKNWTAACRSYGIIWGRMGRGEDCCEMVFEMK